MQFKYLILLHLVLIYRDGKVEATVGGVPASVVEFPWFTSIRKKSDNKLICAGFFAAPGMVITAAHCMTKPPRDLVIEASSLSSLVSASSSKAKSSSSKTWSSNATSTNTSSTSSPPSHHLLSHLNVVLPVHSYFIHPCYNTSQYDSPDIAVAFVSPAALQPSSPYYRFLQDMAFPVLGDWESAELEGKNVVSVGLPTIKPAAPDVATQRLVLPYKVASKATNLGICERLFSVTLETSNQICIRGSIDADTCQGDSGGPVLLEGTQEVVGFTIFGSERKGSQGLACGSGDPSVGELLGGFRESLSEMIELSRLQQWDKLRGWSGREGEKCGAESNKQGGQLKSSAVPFYQESCFIWWRIAFFTLFWLFYSL